MKSLRPITERVTFLLLSFVCMASLLSCARPPLPTLRAQDSPCPLPCWYGIRPGETTADEAVRILKSLPGVEEVKSWPEGSEEPSTIEWHGGEARSWWIIADSPEEVPARGSLHIVKGIVDSLRVNLRVEDTLTLGQIVERYGPPEQYSTGYVEAYHADDSDHWTVALFYYQQGFQVTASVRPENRGNLSPDFEVTDLATFVPTTVEKFFEQRDFPYPHPTYGPWKWPGFGDPSEPWKVPER